MNELEKERRTRSNWYEYHVQGQHFTHKVKMNAVFISSNNTLKHELGKFLACFMIKKCGDVTFTPKTKKLLESLCNSLEKELKEFTPNKCTFITEAMSNEKPFRRVDVVNLTTGDEFEIVVNHEPVNEGSVVVRL